MSGKRDTGPQCFERKAIQNTHSRKRVLKMLREKSTYETAKYIRDLEEKMGFPIKTVQVDNGTEFVNDTEVTGKTSAFEAAVKDLGMNLRRTRPYSL